MIAPEECDGVMCSKCAPDGCKIPDTPIMQEAWEGNTEAVASAVNAVRGNV